jgi:hypothetical protein
MVSITPAAAAAISHRLGFRSCAGSALQSIASNIHPLVAPASRAEFLLFMK